MGKILFVDISGGGTVAGQAFPANASTKQRTGKIKGVVFHHTAGGSLTGALAAGEKNKGATFYIDTDGSIYRYAADDIVRVGIRDPGDKYRTDIGAPTSVLTNDNTISVEIVALDSDHFTDAQRKAAAELGGYLSQTFGIDPSMIVGHGDIQGGAGGHKMPTEGVQLASYVRDQLASNPAVAAIDQAVASQTDTAGPPQPLPYPTWRTSSLDKLETARTEVLNSAAMYGVPAPASGYRPGDQIAPTLEGQPNGLLIDERTMALAGGARLDGVGDGPESWFGLAPEEPVNAAGGVAVAPAPRQTIRVGRHDYYVGDTFDQGGMHYVVTPTGIEKSRIPTGETTILSRIVDQKVGEAVQEAAPKVKTAVDEATAATVETAKKAADAVTEQAGKIGNALGGFAAGFGKMLSGLGAPAEPPKSSVDRLEKFTLAVYTGTALLPSSDDASLEGDSWVPARLRSPTVIPSGSVGRWEISPVRVVEDATLTAPKLSTAIAFDPTFSVKQSFATDRYADMALAMDKFTLPPGAAPAKPAATAPKLDWKLLDGPAWNEAMKRRDDWIRSRPPAPTTTPVRAPTMEETRKEQRIVRTETTTSTVKTPTKPGITGEVAAPAAPTIDKPRALVQRVEIQPSNKPTMKTISVENPGWVDWNRKYGAPVPTGPVPRTAGGDVREGGAGRGNLQAPAPAQAPVVPPAPPRYIEKRVPVPSTSAPKQSALSGGLYVVAAGDTLSSIARRSGVSIETLQRLNGIRDPNVILAGARLRLSDSGNPIAPGPSGRGDGAAAARRGADRGAASGGGGGGGGGGGVFLGKSTGREYKVGQIYVNSHGVEKIAMADGTFQRI
jgi:LysM repeat protein